MQKMLYYVDIDENIDEICIGIQFCQMPARKYYGLVKYFKEWEKSNKKAYAGCDYYSHGVYTVYYKMQNGKYTDKNIECVFDRCT